MFRPPSLRLALAGILVTGVVVVGVVATGGASGATATATATKAKRYDISLGDSYSVGYQNPNLLHSTGFTGDVAKKEKLTLANFGCSGATTTSIFTQDGCPTANSAPASSGGVAYPGTNQVQAALDFIGAHPGTIDLVTVSIGGNDVTACTTLSTAAAILTCVETADTTIATNVGELVGELDTALTAGDDSPAHIVGITYPDVILGDWVAPAGSTSPGLAELSISAFDDLINPTLDTAYTSVTRGSFVNVTDARWKSATAGDDTGTFASTGGAAPFTYVGPTMHLRGVSRTAPAAVAEVCELTWYCASSSFGDIHANTKGYAFIGSLVVADLKSL